MLELFNILFLAYELWFKQILMEVNSVRELFSAPVMILIFNLFVIPNRTENYAFP